MNAREARTPNLVAVESGGLVAIRFRNRMSLVRREIVPEMGIARQSLYDTFGDKRSLYLKALGHYRDETNASMRRLFSSAPTVKDGFAQLLFGPQSESRAQHARGCLLLSANMERAAGDAVITDFLRRNQAEVESIFREALRRAQSSGELFGKILLLAPDSKE